MIRKIIYLFLTTLFLSGCGSFGDEVLPTEPVEIKTELPEEPEIILPRDGGRLNLSMRSPKTLNPLLNEDRSVDNILKLMFEPLAKLDENLKPVPNLAESIEFSIEGLSATIRLKDNLIWNDGSSITAQDIEYSVDILRKAPESVIYKESVKYISGYSIIDNRTIRINFHTPFAGAAYLMCFPIIPKDYYNTQTDKSMAPLGNGLYKFESYTVSDKMTLTKANNAFNKKPLIDEVVVLITSDENTDLNAFEQSIIDVVTSQISDWGKYTSSNNTNITDYNTTYYDFIGFNFKNEIFQDVEMRQMISSVVPIDSIISEVYVGHALKATSPVNPNSWLYEEDVKSHSFTTEQIIRKIEALDYTEEDLLITILVNEENDERVKISNILKSSLETIGFECEINSVDFEEFQDRLENKDFDMFVGGFSLSSVPDFRFAFHSSEIEDGQNYFSLNDPVMDELLEQVFSSIGESNYKNSLSELQKYFAESQPCISIGFKKWAILTNGRIRGNLNPTYSNIYDSIDEWFIYEK